MIQDLRLAWRTLAGNKAFALTALSTLALGIGATTAMFSVTYSVLLRPLPYVESERLVRLSERHPGATTMMARGPVLTNLTYHAWNGQSRTIGPIATYGTRARTIGLDEPTRALVGWLSPSTFDVLRVSPALGRFFNEADARDGATPVALLSDGLWRERFGGNQDALNRTILIDQASHVIVGVAPTGFSFPERDVRLWIPSLPDPATRNGKPRVSAESAIARLLPGATPEQAAAEGTAIARGLERPPFTEFLFGKGGPVEVQVRTIVDDMTATVKPVLLLFGVGVGCLLFIACGNVANLILSRGASRERELAVRLALGAGRARIVRQLLTESVVLALIGGLLGVGLAVLLVRAVPAIAPQDFPRLTDVRLDWTAVAFACAVSLIAGLASGLAPAIGIGRHDLLTGLRSGAGASAGRRTLRLRRTVLAAEASLAMMLLVLAILAGRSFSQLLRVDAGYDAAQVLTARVFLPGGSLKPGEADRFAADLLERLRAIPAVRAAGAGWMAPFARSTSSTNFTIPVRGREPVTARSLVNVVTPGYAEALRLRLRAGRLLTGADLSSPRQSLVVNEEFVRTFLSGVDPLGFNVGVILSRGVEAEVVGVVRNVLKDSLHDKPQPEVYVVAAHRYTVGGEIKLVVRSDGDPMALAGTVRQLVRDLRTDAAIDNVAALSSQVSESVQTERFATTTFGSFTVLAVVLAAVGLYGLLSYTVTLRVREIGIRTALGASGSNIAWMVIGNGMSVAAIGLLIGLIAAAIVARVVQSLLFGVQPLDAVAFIAGPVLLGAVALTACVLPARRAAAIEPAVALRQE